MIDKIVLVTRKTALEDLVERFNSSAQARFYLEHMGLSFAEYEAADRAYREALARTRELLPRDVRFQTFDRAFLPTFKFGPADLVLTLGPDGLVVNTAKYLDGQPLLAVNPDPARVDGILVPFRVEDLPEQLGRVRGGRHGVRLVSMARVDLNDGQRLYGFNDLFVGPRTHVSARYHLRWGGREEDQCSSGIIVSTGAGSTGWMSSIAKGALDVAAFLGGAGGVGVGAGGGTGVWTGGGAGAGAGALGLRLAWEADALVFAVREPFVSKTSSAGMTVGRLDGDATLVIESQMPDYGVIFSDGIERDYLPFNSGAVATVRLAEKKVRLVVRGR